MFKSEVYENFVCLKSPIGFLEKAMKTEVMSMAKQDIVNYWLVFFLQERLSFGWFMSATMISSIMTLNAKLL